MTPTMNLKAWFGHVGFMDVILFRHLHVGSFIVEQVRGNRPLSRNGVDGCMFYS